MHQPPITYQEAVKFMEMFEDIPLAVTEAEIPFLITNINKGWSYLCGYTEEELVGRSFRLIQGAYTDAVATERLCDAAQRGTAGDSVIYNYRKDGSVFANYVQIFPLYDALNPMKVTHYMGFFQEVHYPLPEKILHRGIPSCCP